jgi:hypothetical protein
VPKGNFEPSFKWKKGGPNRLSLVCLCADALKHLPRFVPVHRQRDEVLPRFGFNGSHSYKIPNIARLVVYEGYVIDKQWEVFTRVIYRVRCLSACWTSTDPARILLENSVKTSSCSRVSTAWGLTLRTYISASATDIPFVTQ